MKQFVEFFCCIMILFHSFCIYYENRYCFKCIKDQLISHRNITLLNVSHNLQKHVCEVVRIFAKIQTIERRIILLQGQYKTKRRE